MRINEYDDLAQSKIDELREKIGLEDDEVAMVVLAMYQKIDKSQIPGWMQGD